MTGNSTLLERIAQPAAHQIAEKLATLLTRRGMATEIKATASGYDVQVKNQGVALEFGTYANQARPVVRTTVAEFRSGVGR
jgi:hypothetical protein